MPDAPATTKREKALCYFNSNEMSNKAAGQTNWKMTDETKTWYCMTILGMSREETLSCLALPESGEAKLETTDQAAVNLAERIANPVGFDDEMAAEVMRRRQAQAAQAVAVPVTVTVEDEASALAGKPGTPHVVRCEFCGKDFTNRTGATTWLRNHLPKCPENPARTEEVELETAIA